jgi:hypothetical protein
VSGVGIEKDETGNFVLTVHLDAADAKARQDLPEEIEGHRVRYVASGPFRKQAPASAKASGSRKASGSKKR